MIQANNGDFPRESPLAFGIARCSAGTGLDHLYSVAALTDADGNVVERYRYDAYGDMTVEDVDGDGALTGNPYGFTGRRFDAETGLWYYRTRYLDVHQGRFINRNPWSPNLLGILPPPYSPNSVRGYGFGSYVQGRYSLYDYADGQPSNLVEPFSEADPPDGGGGGDWGWRRYNMEQIAREGDARRAAERQAIYDEGGSIYDPAPPGMKPTEMVYVPVNWANPWVMVPVPKGSEAHKFAVAGYEGYQLVYEAVLAEVIAARLLNLNKLLRSADGKCPTQQVRDSLEQEVRDLNRLLNQMKGAPKPTPNFRAPTNAPQVPPADIPEGWRVREMPPTGQYPDGYWKLEKPMKDGSWQPIDPSTMKPGGRAETHVSFPPN